MIAVSHAQAAEPKRLESGTPGKMFTYLRRDYLGGAGRPGPQAFLVEMGAAGDEIPPHFHRVNQFQVVVSGGGTMGKHAIATLTAHYADAYTPYGPVRVGAEGLAFFTLRPAADSGAMYMPGSRGEMVRKARRNLAGTAALGRDAATETLIAPQADGLGAWLVRAPAGAALDVAPRAGGGSYYVVVRGTALRQGEPLPRWSCLWTDRGEAAPRLVAGPEGAEVAVLSFPLA